MSRHLLASALVLSAFAAVGCSGAAEGTGDEGEVSADALRTTVSPGTFKLYDEPGARPEPSCDVHTVLEIKQVGANGVAALREALDGFCELHVPPNEREFKLTRETTDCGSKIYTGTRTAAGRRSTIKVTDHRTRACRDLVPAQILVEENVAGAGALTKYSFDGAPPSASKASGYDLEGPKALANDRVPVEFCTQALSVERAACEKVDGRVIAANGCKELCSEPIAPRGKTAGYDLTGFKIIASDRAPVEMCISAVSRESAACDRVGGKTSRGNSCKDVCSRPIAEPGKAAGYDLEGFKILPNDRVPVEFCTQVVNEVQERCQRAGGVPSGANGCKQLCSLPL